MGRHIKPRNLIHLHAGIVWVPDHDLQLAWFARVRRELPKTHGTERDCIGLLLGGRRGTSACGLDEARGGVKPSIRRLGDSMDIGVGIDTDSG